MADSEFYEIRPRGELVTDPRIEEICEAVLPAMCSLRHLSDVLSRHGLYKLSDQLLTTVKNISAWQDYTNEVLGEDLPPLTSESSEKNHDPIS